MNRIFYAFIALMALASCANSYDISGTSNVSTLTDACCTLRYWKTTISRTWILRCSARTVPFSGFCRLYEDGEYLMDDDPVLPLVLESGSGNSTLRGKGLLLCASKTSSSIVRSVPVLQQIACFCDENAVCLFRNHHQQYTQYHHQYKNQ